MDKLTEMYVRAYKAIRTIYLQMIESSYKPAKEVVNYALPSPLSYEDTAYTYSIDLKEYKLELPNIHLFETDKKFCDYFDKNNSLNYNSHITTFIGDVIIKGNLDIYNMDYVYITGNLIVEKVIHCYPDTELVVGGTIKAKGIEVAGYSNLFNIRICAEKIEASDVLYIENPEEKIFAFEIKSKFILSGKECFNINCNDLGNESKYEYKNGKVTSDHHYLLPVLEEDVIAIKSLFNPLVFKYSDSEQTISSMIWGMFFDIFNALKEDEWLTDDYEFIPVDIWKE